MTTDQLVKIPKIIVRGDYYFSNQETPKKRLSTLEQVAEQLFTNYDTILLEDLDSIFYDKPHYKLIRELSVDFKIWLEGKVANIGALMDFFVAGAEIVVINSANISLKLLNDCCAISSAIALKTSYENLAETYRLAQRAGIEKIVCSVDNEEFCFQPDKNIELFADISMLSAYTKFMEDHKARLAGFIISLKMCTGGKIG